MRRIGLAVVLAISLTLASLVAEPQQTTQVARIGFLWANRAANPNPRGYEALLQGLRGRGWVEGRNLVIEHRSAEGKHERLPALAAELVVLKVDLILAPNPVTALA